MDASVSGHPSIDSRLGCFNFWVYADTKDEKAPVSKAPEPFFIAPLSRL
jgi:hypothetical protein